MQIKKEDTMESVDVSAEQSRFSKKSRNKHGWATNQASCCQRWTATVERAEEAVGIFRPADLTSCTQMGQRKTRNRCAHIFTKIYTTVTADRDQAWWVYLSPLVPSHSGCTHSILSRHLSKNGINQSLYQGLGRKSNCTDHYRFLYPDVSYYL